MNNFNIRIKIKDGEVKGILDELTEAQKKIYECYDKLQMLGVVEVEKKEVASFN